MNNPEIVIVEDNYNDVEMITDALNELKINKKVCILRDGVEAIKYFFNSAGGLNLNISALPKLVLLDLKLPKIDGLEVLKKIRGDERTKLLPVVILTSSAEQSDVVNGYSLGANSYVRKPVEFNQFVEAMRHLGLYWLLWNEPPPVGK